jgi:hypothetical protein
VVSKQFVVAGYHEPLLPSEINTALTEVIPLMIIKVIIIWVFIATGEIINGNVRVKYLQRKYGLHRAKQISFLSGITIFTIIIWLFLPWVGPRNLFQCFGIGLIWTSLMLLVDLYFGRFVFHYSWAKIIEDFNLGKGNLLGLGMLILLLSPATVFLIRS